MATCATCATCSTLACLRSLSLGLAVRKSDRPGIKAAASHSRTGALVQYVKKVCARNATIAFTLIFSCVCRDVLHPSRFGTSRKGIVNALMPSPYRIYPVLLPVRTNEVWLVVKRGNDRELVVASCQSESAHKQSQRALSVYSPTDTGHKEGLMTGVIACIGGTSAHTAHIPPDSTLHNSAH